MTRKTLWILGAVGVGGCCFLGGGVMLLGLAAGSADSSPSTPATAAAASGGPYRVYGEVRPVANGYAGSLAGQWLFMDGATIDSIESITGDTITVRSKRSGELWHFKFDDDGSYQFRHIVSAMGMSTADIETGEYASDGSTLTLTPTACLRGDCQALEAVSYALSTVTLVRLQLNDVPEETFEGLQLRGTVPSFVSSGRPVRSVALQRVRP